VDDNYTAQKIIERRLWSDVVKQIPSDITNAEFLSIPPGLPTTVDVKADKDLTNEEIEKLKDGWVLYFATIFIDHHRKVVLESCVHSSVTLTSETKFCVGHN
jgi:hypothetical protein